MFLRALCVVVASVMLVACSPEYNWREVGIPGSGVTVIFPDKPKVDEKRFVFEGETLVLSMTGTTVKDEIFAVGHAQLSSSIQSDDPARQALYQQVVGSFYSNFDQSVPNPLPAPGELFVVTGEGPNGGMQLSAKVWMFPDYLLEAIVVAPQPNFPDGQAQEFFSGIVF